MKFLITYKYGAGWSSWNGVAADYLLYHKRLISELEENPKKFQYLINYSMHEFEKDENVKRLSDEIKNIYGKDCDFCILALPNILVESCRGEEGDIKVKAYDGRESWTWVYDSDY